MTIFFSSTSFAAGTSISNGTPIEANITSSTTHTYQFTTDRDGQVYITLDQGTARFYMKLVDGFGKSKDTVYTSNGQGVLTADLEQGTYYIEVIPYNWSGITNATYRVKATYPSTFTRNAATFETNDTKETSMNISNGSYYSSNAETSIDKDVYQFTTNKDGEVYITLDQGTGRFYFRLVDSFGKSKDSVYTSDGQGVLTANVAQGTYYIEVIPYNWAGITSATYRLKATYPSTFTSSATTFETNDTKETSMNISNGKIYSSKADTNIDRDVYNFTTNASGEVYITFDKSTASYYVRLRDSSGNSKDYNYISSGGNGVLYANLPKGTYYLYIDPYNWNGITSGSYRIKATYPSTFTRDSTTFETNDTAQTSLKMISNKVYSSNSHSNIDRDVYQFTTNSDGSASITLDKVTNKYYVKLVDIYGKTKDYDYVYSGEVGTLTAVLQKGTYYLYIDPYNWSGTTSGTYRVKANFKDKTPSVDVIYDTGTILTGMAVSNTKVYAYAGSVKIGETTAKNGRYSMTIGKRAAGTTIGVYTVDAAGNRSATIYIKVIKAIPSTPIKLTAKKISSSSMTLSWAKVAGANGYKVYRATSKTGTYSQVGSITSGSTVKFTNKSLTNGKTYYYKVRAYRTINRQSFYSNYSAVKTYKH